MKSRISLLVMAGLLLPVVALSPVFAMDSTGESTTTTTTTNQDSTTQTETQPEKEQLTDTQKQELQQRIEQRKAEAKLRLSAAQEKRIKLRCKNAQGLIRVVSGRVKSIETNRGKVHTNLVDRLNKLQAKVAAKGVDTTTLKSQIAELETKIATFNTDLAVYKQTVADLGNIDDCTADPTAFKASLEDARAALLTVKQDALVIRSYINDTIKPTLKAIRAQLEPATNDSTQPSEGTN